MKHNSVRTHGYSRVYPSQTPKRVTVSNSAQTRQPGTNSSTRQYSRVLGRDSAQIRLKSMDAQKKLAEMTTDFKGFYGLLEFWRIYFPWVIFNVNLYGRDDSQPFATICSISKLSDCRWKRISWAILNRPSGLNRSRWLGWFSTIHDISKLYDTSRKQIS